MRFSEGVRGVDGFSVDVCNAYFMDLQVRNKALLIPCVASRQNRAGATQWWVPAIDPILNVWM